MIAVTCGFDTRVKEEVSRAKRLLDNDEAKRFFKETNSLVRFEHEDLVKTYGIDSLDVFCADCCGDPEENEDLEWVFDVLENCRKENDFVRQLKALFALYPEFFNAIKESKNKIVGKGINEDLFSIFER